MQLLRRNVEQDVAAVPSRKVSDTTGAGQSCRDIAGCVEPPHLNEALAVLVHSITENKHYKRGSFG